MPARVTVKAVNEELARLGHRVLLEKGSGYFYFRTGDAADWLNRTVAARKISDMTLEEWIAEFGRLKALNEQITGAQKKPSGARLSRRAR